MTSALVVSCLTQAWRTNRRRASAGDVRRTIVDDDVGGGTAFPATQHELFDVPDDLIRSAAVDERRRRLCKIVAGNCLSSVEAPPATSASCGDADQLNAAADAGNDDDDAEMEKLTALFSLNLREPLEIVHPGDYVPLEKI